MADEIIAELWKIKDNMAREFGYDIDALCDYFQKKSEGPNRRAERTKVGTEGEGPDDSGESS